MMHSARHSFATFLAGAAIMSASPVQGAEWCAELTQVLRLARNGTAEPFPPGAATCATSRSQGGAVATHCAWAFPYRAKEAVEAFEAISRSAPGCLGANVEPVRDLGVNHPDTYELRQFQVAGSHLAISLKDKAAIGKTYVFVRAENRP